MNRSTVMFSGLEGQPAALASHTHSAWVCRVSSARTASLPLPPGQTRPSLKAPLHLHLLQEAFPEFLDGQLRPSSSPAPVPTALSLCCLAQASAPGHDRAGQAFQRSPVPPSSGTLLFWKKHPFLQHETPPPRGLAQAWQPGRDPTILRETGVGGASQPSPAPTH